MRYSPNGTRITYERQQQIEVADAATGATIGVWPWGHNPRWVGDTWIVCESHDGQPMLDQLEDITVQYVPANRGQLDANGHGTWAVSDLNKTTVHGSSRYSTAIAAREPRVSASGMVAVRGPHNGFVRYLDGWDTELGPCENSRWSSETLVWWLDGRVWGRTTPDQPTVELTVPFRACAHPCPLWTGTHLFVLLVLDDGELWLAEWGSLVRGEARGWPIGRSSGQGFDWDARAHDGHVDVCYFDPHGTPTRTTVDPTLPPWSMLKPPAPEPIPDEPWVTDPNGVVEDASLWVFSRDQGPDVTFSPDGTVRFYLKSDEVSAEGKAQGEHWDEDADYIGHLDDASTGRRILDGKEVIAEDIVRMFPDTHAQVWASLPLNHNYFTDGRRLWMPRRCVSGTSITYVTDITWDVPPRETPHTRVWKNIPIEIRVDVGRAVIGGKEARLRVAYIPDGHEEVNFYGPPKGYNAWIAGPMSWADAGGLK